MLTVLPPAAACRIALSTRMTTSWRSRAVSAMSGTGSASIEIATLRAVATPASSPTRVEGQVPEVGRPQLELDGAGIRPREDEQVVDEGRQPVGPGLDVVDGIADLGDGLVAMAAEVGRRCPSTTARGVRSSWLASAANSRWRRIASRIGTSARSAYTRPTRSDAPTATMPPSTSTTSRTAERPLLVCAIARDLDHEHALWRCRPAPCTAASSYRPPSARR